jgi:hypothetical protein
MTVVERREPFDAVGLKLSPDEPGVYVLFHNERTIFIGMADKSIRDELEYHMRGKGGTLTSHATSFRSEVTASAAAEPRELELLDAFKLRNNMNVPRGNRQLAVASPAPAARSA